MQLALLGVDEAEPGARFLESSSTVEDTHMMIAYRVVIQDEVHVVRIWVPASLTAEQQGEVEEFALSTAILERCGYLPRNVASAVV